MADGVAAELQKLGGTRIIPATTTNAMTAAVGGLGLHGAYLPVAGGTRGRIVIHP